MAAPTRTRRPHLRLLLPACAVGILLAVHLVDRTTGKSGYAPDEELTWFAVRGVSETGLPILPSGILYDRGLPYTYAAWLAGAVFGHSLETYRAVSLLFGCLSVLLAGAIARRLGGMPSLAALLTAGFVGMLIAIQWARFYSMFVALYLATVLLFFAAVRESRWRPFFILGLTAARLLHETGAALVALPLFLCVSGPDPRLPPRGVRIRLLLGSLFALATVQVALYGIRALPGQSGGPSLAGNAYEELRSLFALPSGAILELARSPLSWLGLAALAVAAYLAAGRLALPHTFRVVAVPLVVSFQLGLLLLVTVFATLARAHDGARYVTWSALAGGMSLAFWAIHTAATTPAALAPDLLWSLARFSLDYPMAGVSHALLAWPLVVIAVAGALALRGQGPQPWRTSALGGLLLAHLAFLGLVMVGPAPRYFLPALALSFVLASTLPSSLFARGDGERRAAPRFVAAALGATILCEQSVSRNPSALFEKSWPSGLFSPVTLKRAPLADWQREVQAWKGDRGTLVCNDDLACQLLFGRVDYWWLSDARDADRFGITRGGVRRSVYTGARLIVGDEQLRERADTEQDLSVVVLDTAKYGYEDTVTALKRLGGRQSPVFQVDKTPGLALARPRALGGKQSI